MDVVIAAHAGEGDDTDEIALVRSYPASITQPSVFNHIHHVGRQIGEAAGRFLSMKKAAK